MVEDRGVRVAQRVMHQASAARMVQAALAKAAEPGLATSVAVSQGKREDVLCQVDGQWHMRQRKVVLEQNVLLAQNLTFFQRGGHHGHGRGTGL